MSQSTENIRQFILDNLVNHPKDITAVTSAHFSISRQAVLKHLHKMVEEGQIYATGEKNKREYTTIHPVRQVFKYTLPGIDEGDIYINDILPLIKKLPDNVISIAQYCFTEMANNANDHSEGSELIIYITIESNHLSFFIKDNGIGIFKKISSALGLANERYAILELEKGKLTTDKARHSGEGIFFTSRLVDEFSISSGELSFSHVNVHEKGYDILDENDKIQGTTVLFTINTNSVKTANEIFSQYADEDFAFTKTMVRVDLLRVGEENLVSRSQAKRLLARFEKFKEIMLDFTNVETIGQAFADEIFRVFALQHPNIVIHTINTTKAVDMMIKRAKINKDENFTV